MPQNQARFPVFAATLLTVLVSAWPARGQIAAQSIRARAVTFTSSDLALQEAAAEIGKQTGMEVDVSALDPKRRVNVSFARAEFWKAVDRLAEQAGGRIAVGSDGKVRLVKAVGPRLANAVDGPFIVMPRAVEARLDLLTGKTVYDLTIDVAWEPRLPVYRIDAQPRVTAGRDDGGRPITVKPIDSRTPTSGAVATLRFHLDGPTRDSQRIVALPGTLRITAAEEMLRFDFDDLTKPTKQTQQGVEVALRNVAKEGTCWIADAELNYPRGGAEFESFETYWLGRNRLALISPDGTRFPATDEEIDGRRVRYRFKEGKSFAPKDLRGWKLTYEAPGPIREVPVTFELKGIGLP